MRRRFVTRLLRNDRKCIEIDRGTFVIANIVFTPIANVIVALAHMKLILCLAKREERRQKRIKKNNQMKTELKVKEPN